MEVKKFEELEIWQLARELCKYVYQLALNKKFSYDFRFQSQIRAAAGSVMDNIAEGFERGGNKEFIHFLYIAKGSCGEVRSQTYRAKDQVYISYKEHNELLNQTMILSGKITKPIKHLKNSDFKGSKYH